MSYKLPELPYKKDDLEPVITSRTIDFHYGKHHQAYVNNLNKLTEGTDFAGKDLEYLIKNSDGGIFNNAAQVWNHTFYWESMCPGGKSLKEGALKTAIEGEFGSFEAFVEQFSKASATLFGSGWSWLVKEKGSGKLKIMQGSNAWNPIKEGHQPILTCDVWEHAYYLDYQNLRPKYIEEFLKLVDWDRVEARFGA